ncbi:hypothetical protein A2U01_0059800, partial [Trifolium medium]|nr:hypothetical protein [Trifolium medium]
VQNLPPIHWNWRGTPPDKVDSDPGKIRIL